MKFIAAHDKDGTIVALISIVPNAPAVSIPPGPGRTLAQIEIPEEVLDISSLETEQRVVDALRAFRIDVTTEAKLVRRTSREDC